MAFHEIANFLSGVQVLRYKLYFTSIYVVSVFRRHYTKLLSKFWLTLPKMTYIKKLVLINDVIN